MKKKLLYTATRTIVTTQNLLQTHWWSTCIQFPLTPVLNYFHHNNDLRVFQDLDGTLDDHKKVNSQTLIFLAQHEELTELKKVFYFSNESVSMKIY